MKNYQMEINGWNFSGDNEAMSYWKDFGEKRNFRTEAVALCWLDTVEGDQGYNPEGDCYCCIWSEGFDAQNALDGLYNSNACFGDVMRREEAEKFLIEYMKRN